MKRRPNNFVNKNKYLNNFVPGLIFIEAGGRQSYFQMDIMNTISYMKNGGRHYRLSCARVLTVC